MLTSGGQAEERARGKVEDVDKDIITPFNSMKICTKMTELVYNLGRQSLGRTFECLLNTGQTNFHRGHFCHPGHDAAAAFSSLTSFLFSK
jgi:hypothetical protein